MSAVMTLARLGLALSGTNEDLELIPPENSSGKGQSDDSDPEDGDESEDESGSGGESDDAEDSDDSGDESEGGGDSSDSDESDDGDGEDDTEGSGSSDGEDTDDGEDDTEGSGSSGGDSDDEGDESEGTDSSGDDGDSEARSWDGPEGESDEGGDTDLGEEGEDEGFDYEDSTDGDGPSERAPRSTSGEEGGDEHTDGAAGAGGHEDTDLSDLAQELIDAFESGAESGLTDNNSALTDAVKDEVDGDAHCEPDEQVWRPYNPGLDKVQVVVGGDAGKARALKNKVKKEISYLRSQLRNKFLQARTPRTIHGVRKGRELSERRLVNSVIELRGGRRPTRPDWDRETRDDCSLAMAVVLDESSSMGRKLATAAAAAALAISVPLDELGAPCLVVGSRDGSGYDYSGNNDPHTHTEDGAARYHRYDGIVIDVFKDWDEPMRKALPRFSRVQSTGCTPLSDGIQYAMQHISERPERHRVIGVVTDGWPDNQAVVRRQIRIAREAGVHVVGIGISSGCHAVTELFPTHVSVHKLDQLPKEMLGVLSAIMFPKKGKRIALDGKFRAVKNR
jgi:hypothetical protein